jgi:hypothetical protein
VPAKPGRVLQDAHETVRRLMERWDSNEWGGSDSAEEIEAARFAVVVERDEDSWVVAAETVEDVAGIALGCLTGTEGYDEWVAEVWDVQRGEQVAWSKRVVVRVVIGDESAEVCGGC